MKDNKTKRKQKIMKFLAISSIVISLVLSSIALHNSSDLDELKSGSDGEYAWAHGEMSNEWIIIH